MSKKMIGVEIGSDSVKLAVCVNNEVTSMAMETLPENLVRDGKVTSPNAMSNLIKSMCKKNGIRPGPCAFVIPPQLVISHRVTTPLMGEKELMLNLPFEFRDFVGKEGEKYDYDYSVISVNGNSMDIYASAVMKEAIDVYYGILKKAGLTMKIAVPSEMAWLNLIRHAKNEPKNLCILDIGHRSTRVNIFSDNSFVMGKEIELAGQFLDDTIANMQKVDPYVARTHKEANLDNVLASDACYDDYNAIAVEVMKVINYYNYSCSDQGAKLQDIYYCGGTSAIEALRTVILKNTSLTPHNVRRLVGLNDDDTTLPLYCTLAAGAAFQEP